MLKRMICLALVMFGCICMTGCTTTLALTEEETKLIAEYTADVLLKHDLNYRDRFEEGKEQVLEMEENAVTEQTDTEESTQESVSNQTEEVSDLEVPDKQDAVAESESDIAKIAGIDGASITYKDYLITDEYPTRREDTDVVSLTAKAGYQLLVLRFTVENVTQDTLNLSLIDSGLEYHLIDNHNKTSDPMLTILLDDLGTFETTLEPAKSQEAVLVFQITDDAQVQLDPQMLKVTYQNVDHTIDILN